MWFVEFAPSRVVGTIRTIVGSARPRGFWSRVQMTHPLRWRRFVLYLLVLLLLPVGAYVAEQASVAARHRWLVARAPGVVAVRHSYPAAIIEAVIKPMAGTSAGRIRLRGGPIVPYTAPRRLHNDLLWNARPWAGPRTGVVERIFTPIAAWTYGTMLYAWLPIGFVFLPRSRRRARVRWRHVWRVAGYGLVFPSLVLSAFLVLLAIGLVHTAWYGAVALVEQGLALGLVPMLIVWWSFAIGRYLHLPHGPAVAILLTVMGGLLVPSIIVLVLGASAFF